MSAAKGKSDKFTCTSRGGPGGALMSSHAAVDGGGRFVEAIDDDAVEIGR